MKEYRYCFIKKNIQEYGFVGFFMKSCLKNIDIVAFIIFLLIRISLKRASMWVFFWFLFLEYRIFQYIIKTQLHNACRICYKHCTSVAFL